MKEEPTQHCCKEFAEQAKTLQPPMGGGFMYPPDMRPNAQFEKDSKTGTWNIYGCCGGGCFVVTRMKFCPFCGSQL